MASYRLQDPGYGITGPISLETVRDLAEGGVVSADVHVSRDGGPFLPVRAFDEVFALVSPYLNREERPTYTGDLGVLSFFKVFHRLHACNATGELVVRDGVLRKEVFLEEGQPIFVVSWVLRERFGEFLVDRGRISREQLAAALQESQRLRASLGETLVAEGVLDRGLMLEELREQQLSRLVDLCTWSSGHYQFREGSRFKGSRVELGPMVAETVLRAARVVPDKTVLLRLGSHLHQLARLRHNALMDACRRQLDAAEQRALKRLDGTRTVVELARAEGERRACLSVLYLLWEIEAVEFRSRPPAA